MKAHRNLLGWAALLAAATQPLAPARAQVVSVGGGGTALNIAPGTLVSVVGGALNVQSGATVNNQGTVAFTGDFANAGALTSATGQWQAAGTALQTLSSTGSGALAALDVANPAGAALGGPLAVGALSLSGGSLRLAAYDLTLTGALTNATATRFVVTNGAGRLRQPVGAAPVLFPVGPTDARYRPLTLARSAGSGVYGAGTLLPAGSPGPAIASRGVGLRWNVAPPDAVPYDLTVEWQAADELAPFARAASALARWNGSAYAPTAFGPATGGGPYQRNSAGLTAGGFFAVFDQQSPLPTRVAGFGGFNLVAYPNPVGAAVAFKTAGAVPAGLVLTLLAADGRRVWERPASEALLHGAALLDVSGLAEGPYLLRYQAPDGTQGSQRLLVQR